VVIGVTPHRSPRLHLMALLIVSMGDLAEVASGSQRPMVAPVPRVPSAGGTTYVETGAGW
jgi:hypothetical protein